MIFGAEIGLLLVGIYGLFTGRLVLTKQLVVRGLPARLLAIVACAPLTFAISFAVLRTRAAGTNPASGSKGWSLIALEGGILLVCVAVVYVVGWLIAVFSNTDAGAGSRTPTESSEVVAIPAASQSNMKGYFVPLGVGAAVFIAGLLICGYWPGMKDNFFAAQSSETPDSDVDEIPPAPTVAGPVPASLLPAPAQARVDRMLRFNRQTLAGAYDQVGKKSREWDEHAHAAMELTAIYFSNPTDPRAQAKDIRAATQKALDAGCDDPLILFLHARSADPKTPDAKLDGGYAKAAKAMWSSDYPPMRRASALLKAVERKFKRQAEPDAKAEALRMIAATLRLLLASAREEERCQDLEGTWYEIARDTFAAYRQLGYDPRESWRGMDKLLAKENALEATRLLLQGDCFIQWAWEARGSGYAKTTTGDGKKKFDEHLTMAREALEKSLQLAPDYGKPATFMLTVELGQSRGRADMEKWFERAIEHDPSVTVCRQKLEWLHPKWHGSTEEMLAFGRACRDSENWVRGYPLIVVEAHQKIADMQPSDVAKSDYFRQLDVAADVLYVFAKSVERYPEDTSMRSRYAYYCFLCGHPRRAHRQFELVGDKLWWDDIFTETLMKQTRSKAAKQAGQTRP
jgi:hypothetical protein